MHYNRRPGGNAVGGFWQEALLRDSKEENVILLADRASSHSPGTSRAPFCQNEPGAGGTFTKNGGEGET